MPRGIYKRNTRSAAQLQRTINGLEAQLSHAQTSLESAQALLADTQKVVRNQTESLHATEQQRDQATARAYEFEQHNGRLYSQVVQLRAELDLNKQAMLKGIDVLNEGSDRVTTLKAELTAMERALAIVSGVRATG
jgi:chromosome segregation ATPase